MQIQIISPEKILFEGEVNKVFVPGKKGQFEILERHAPIISSLSAGKVKCEGEQAYEVMVQGGFIEMNHQQISICVEI